MLKPLILTLFLLFSSLLQAAEKFIIDDQHSYLLWHIQHLGFSSQTGKWFVKGFIVFDKNHPKNSHVEVNIPIADMITGIEALDKHLKGKDFFDVKKYPQAKFISNQITITGKDSAKITGMLTLHGITKPISLDVKLNKAGKHPFTKKNTLGFSATTTLKRADFGMNGSMSALSDAVNIDIAVEAQEEGDEKENAVKK